MRILCLLLALPFLLPAKVNTLSPTEIAAGWILLFDGHTLFGWKPVHGARFRVSHGAILGEGPVDGALRSTTAFADYVLKLEFRAGPRCNSGVFVRSAGPGKARETGYEVQIWNHHPKYPTGSLVDHASGHGNGYRPGRWNQYEITVDGDHWRVKLNGRVVLDTHQPGPRMGHIGLQYHPGNRIEFRDIKLKPLGLKPIFNGRDLSGWRRVDRPHARTHPRWSAVDGAIHVEGGPGLLETRGTWRNFVLQLAIRTNPRYPGHHPNSGIFFRNLPGNLYGSGYEAQIRNQYAGGDRNRAVDFGTGGIYHGQAARRIVADEGHYFTETLVADGRHLAVWVNGYEVTDWTDPRPAGTNVRHKRAVLHAGTITFQAHDATTDVDFKDIRIAGLPD